MDEKYLMRLAAYTARVKCHDLGGLIIELDNIIGSKSNGKKKQERFKKTTDEIYETAKILFTVCCKISGREFVELSAPGAEFTCAFEKGEN